MSIKKIKEPKIKEPKIKEPKKKQENKKQENKKQENIDENINENINENIDENINENIDEKIDEKILTEKAYENLILTNDKFTEDIRIALGLVKKYVVDNKLIIVGGMSIDMALRLKGSKLYDDNILPDYDFYSYKYHADAYKIAEMLHNAGLKNISVINASHVSTMRVRVNYIVVADVTYMPKVIFDNLPTLLYRDIVIIHPHYQMIDQHKALTMPYENPPWEVISNRWKKDTIRYDLLYEYYPITVSNIDLDQSIKLTDEIKISTILFNNQCMNGFVGLLYWHKLAVSYGFKEKTNLGIINVDSGGLVVQIPKDSHGITVYSNNVVQLYKSLKSIDDTKTRQYNGFLDKLPYKIIIDKWELFDNNGHMISAHKLDNMLYISNLQHIMLYMLTNFTLLKKMKDTDRGDTFYIGYLLAYSIVKWASESYASKPNNKYMVFLPSPEVYGDSEISDSYLNSKRLFLEKIKDNDKKKIQPKCVFPETFKNGKIPNNYYKFIPNKSPILQFDGLITNDYFDRIKFIES